jgi:predicted P-loop ATPase
MTVVPFPPPPAERKQRLYDWAAKVLSDVGVFDPEDPVITLAIRDALHPATGAPEAHFIGLREGALKRILRSRFEATHPRANDWTEGLIRKKDGTIAPVLANLVLMLRNSPPWRGVLAYDEFKARVIIRKRPPWGPEDLDAPWVDHHEALTRVWFQQQGVNAAFGDTGRAIQTVARDNKFHPVRARLQTFVRNGTSRLDTWLVDYFHADVSTHNRAAYIHAIGSRWLISAVARIYQPGCKADHMPIFEGPQGRLKSEALRTLALDDAWFTDRLSNLSNKDAAMELAGIWLVEIGELDALFRSTTSAAKNFISARHDKFRPPYGKHTVAFPRQNVFAGTINPPAEGYLKDPTGARRFWPVKCIGMIDRPGLEQAREQLWAEAVYRFKRGDPWWLETPELEVLATAEQEARFVIDEWQSIISAWLAPRTDVSIPEVLEQALGFTREQWSEAAQKRVGRILTRLGFERWRPSNDETGKRERRFHRSSK